MCDIAVLDTQHNVVVGAAAWGLVEELAGLQRGRHARHGTVTGPPRLTVVVRLAMAPAARAVPDHFLWPCTVPEDISAIKGVDGGIFFHLAFRLTEQRLPVAKQHLVLKVDDGEAVSVGLADNAVEVL